VVLKLGHFGKRIRNTREVLKCGAGVGWKRPAESIVWEMKKTLDLHRAKEELNMLQAIRRIKVNLLRTKHNLLYIRNQSVTRCKLFQPRL
jgi:hypothetical protein